MVMSRVCLLNLFFFSFLFPSNNLDSSLRNLFLVCPLYASSFLKLHYVFLLPLISYIYFQVRIKTITLCRTRQKLMIIQKKRGQSCDNIERTRDNNILQQFEKVSDILKFRCKAEILFISLNSVWFLVWYYVGHFFCFSRLSHQEIRHVLVVQRRNTSLVVDQLQGHPRLNLQCMILEE